ncbi:transposase family protein [Streptomyces sp. NPDC047515]|uniref:transposase family protein n=1 Tax=Streptomyces sp. NPDC047515 TaxID=3155380 RepID=UPI0033CC221D
MTLIRTHCRTGKDDRKNYSGKHKAHGLLFLALTDGDPVIITGRKATRNHKLTAAEKEANRLVSRERAANEHGFANLKSWRNLTKLRTDTRQATTLLRALLVLTNSEVQR